MHFPYILMISELVDGLRVRFGLACVPENGRSAIQREGDVL